MSYTGLGQAGASQWWALWKNTGSRWVFVAWLYGPSHVVDYLAVSVGACKSHMRHPEDTYIITAGDGSNRIIGGLAKW